MVLQEIMDTLVANSNKESLEGMARFGINTQRAFGVSIPLLRGIAKQHKKDHVLAIKLWETGYHEARILASMVDDPSQVTEKQMEQWVKEFNSWDLCDQCCMNLFRNTSYAYSKAIEWTSRKEEFIKRAGFAMMATLAVGDKKAKDDLFYDFFPLIIKESTDSRNFVKKAVNWALRQIGKRNSSLNQQAVNVAQKLILSDDRAAQWIGKDAYKELTNQSVIKRLK